MKIIIKYYLTIILASGLNPNVHSQGNLVPNPSFEDKDFLINANKPNAQAQLEKSNNWKNFNTSDWYSAQSGFFNGHFDETGSSVGYQGPGTLPARNGNHYIGFGSCEGAQVQLTSKVEKFHFVQVGFWFSPRTRKDAKINIYLLKNKADNNALDDCNNPNITFEFHEEIEVNSEGTDAIHTPGVWYHYTSNQVLIIQDEYEWLAIKGDNVEGDFSDWKYVYVDNIQVVAIPFCNHICAPQATITHSTLPTIMCGNTDASCMPCDETSCFFPSCCQTFRVLIENAIGIEFSVFDSWGALNYYYDCFDVNGLLNPGYTDFLLEWNGNHNNGNNLPQDLYIYKLKLWSCAETLLYVNPILVIPPTENAYIIPKIHNYSLTNCCPDNAFFQNIHLTGNSRTDVNDFITAGENVTAGIPGPVVIENNAFVIWSAGNEINIEPGVTVEVGSFLLARIADCGSAIAQKKAPVSRWDYYEIASKIDYNKEQNKIFNTEKNNHVLNFAMLPNPTTGVLQIITDENSFNITVFDVMGRIVFYSNISKLQSEINLSSSPPGLYFVKIITGDEVFVQKLIISE